MAIFLLALNLVLSLATLISPLLNNVQLDSRKKNLAVSNKAISKNYLADRGCVT